MIDKILYINLEHRKDRENRLLDHLKKYDFDITKIQKIDAVLDKICGHIGCGKSHIKAIELALTNGWDEIMILEDDFNFTVSKEIVKKTLDDIVLADYDIVLFAAPQTNLPSTQYSFLNRAINCTTASGYLIKKQYYERLLNNFKESIKIMERELLNHVNNCQKNNKTITKLVYCTAIDQHWKVLQHTDKFYITNPVLGCQISSFSDNNNSIEAQENLIAQYKRNN